LNVAFILSATGCSQQPPAPAESATAPPEADATPANKTEPIPSATDPAAATAKPAAESADNDNKGPAVVSETPAVVEPAVDDSVVQRRRNQPADAPYEGLTRLTPEYDVWVDKANKQVVLVGEVCLRNGPLEMLACLRSTKEHESILTVNTKAQVAHAGLLAIGAEAGTPVQFLPEFRPASGAEVEITLVWKDADGKEHRDAAQSWIRNTRTMKPMEEKWIFAGSGFYVNEENGERFYKAEDGDFICISNFPSAMLDVAVESSATNTQLLFEANTDAIPPKGTKVTILLKPKTS
jgi:hypothetical protein